ncbi:MAG: 50S ribosomal protein L11 methyltransferase [Clostridiales bacterium]|nr:50S ribosomal protein L11 methyltransferase [Candidatus Equinaster intestinalis]
MDWFEIFVKVDTADTDIAAGICNMAAPGGIYIEDYSDLEQQAWEISRIDLIDEELVNKDRTKSIIHLFVSPESNPAEYMQYISENLKASNIAFEIGSASVNEADWADNWKKYFKVTEIGSRLVICPSWEKYDNNDKRAVLRIDPGAAFGTGTHATTSLCLALLEKYIKGGERVLDVGSGSGILSIAALLLGADTALGVDIDPVAVKVAAENAELNGVGDKAKYILGDITTDVSGKYSVVLANIVADIIIKLNGEISDFLEKDAVYITSGIIDLRAQDVKKSFAQCGFTIIEECRRDNWYAFALKKGEF